MVARPADRTGQPRWRVVRAGRVKGLPPGSAPWQARREEVAMARVNDVGGVEGFALPERELDEPPFHSDWEAHVFAMNRALIGAGVYGLDEFRDAVERMPPAQYLASSYYEKWLHAITTLLVEKGVATPAELEVPAGG